MPPSWVGLQSTYQARGKGTHLLLDVSAPNASAYAVIVSHVGVVVWRALDLNEAQAVELYDAMQMAPGKEGEGAWLCVLARCRGRPARVARWEGSPAEYASRFFDIGTFEWVVTLNAIRERQLDVDARLKFNYNVNADCKGKHLKLFEDLQPEQQARAVETTFERLVVAVTECGLRFDDIHNGNHLQQKIDAAQLNAAGFELSTGDWQVEVRLRCKDELLVLAAEAARTAVFTEGETTIDIGEL